MSEVRQKAIRETYEDDRIRLALVEQRIKAARESLKELRRQEKMLKFFIEQAESVMLTLEARKP